jgi:septum formation protein
MTDRRLVLASTSPYRRALLERLAIPFDCVAPGVDEAPRPGEPPRDLALRLARAKAAAVAAARPGSVVIAGDQVVALDGQPLGKPGSPEAAAAQLRRLAGRCHELLTAVAILDGERSWEHLDATRLTMRPLDDAEIARYVERDRAWDCAGAYKIESLGIALFASIETSDPTAIVGFPLMAVAEALRSFGFRVP